MDTSHIIAHIISAVAVAIFFVSYQTKNAKVLVLLQSVATALFCVHYLLIGATSGLALNIICILRNFIYYHRDKKIFSHKAIPYLLSLIMALIGVFSWQAYYSLFIIAGLAVNTFCLSFPDAQKVRISVLFTCPLVFIYNVFVFSVGGMVNESISFLSALIGVIRLREKDKKTSR